MPPLAAVPDLERELDGLYALPLESFTKARNDLAARLRKAHQEDAAAEVRSLRKPGLVAWVANQLARTHPDLVAALLDAGKRLRDVQQRALTGRATAAEVADATGGERNAVRALVAAAREELGGRVTPQLLDRLTRTLRATAVDPEAGMKLAAGRLAEELQAVGFGPLQAVSPSRPAAARPDDARRAARERVKALRAESRRLQAELRQADAAAEAADREAKRVHAEADTLRREAERVADALARAERAPG